MMAAESSRLSSYRKVLGVGCFIGLVWFGPVWRVAADPEVNRVVPELLPPPLDVRPKLISLPRNSLEEVDDRVLPIPNPIKQEDAPKGNGIPKENGGFNLAPLNKNNQEALKEIPKTDSNKPEAKVNGVIGSGGRKTDFAAGRTWTLAECIKTAHERSPMIGAVRSSLQSALASRQGIEKTSRIVHSLLAPDLSIRKEQASQGIFAAQAELDQTMHDVTFHVVQAYYTAVYAKAQLTIANEQVQQLVEYVKSFESFAQDDLFKITKNSVDLMRTNLVKAKLKLIEAEQGRDRALRALAHEMSMGMEPDFDIADSAMPNFKVTLDREGLRQHALNRRGEVLLAQTGAEVLKLEMGAQGSVRWRLRLPTAAAGGDVHTKPVPTGSRDGEYRPDALGPEYPMFLVGDRSSRIQKAMELHKRSQFVVQKTKDLVVLEIDNAFFRWEEASRKADVLKEAKKVTDSLLKRLRADEDNEKAFTPEKLQAEVVAIEFQVNMNEVLYQQILSLAALERGTAGALHVHYPGR